MTPAELISTADAATILGLSPRRVRQLRDALRAVPIGSSLVFPRAAVEEYAAAPRTPPGYPKGRPRKPAP